MSEISICPFCNIKLKELILEHIRSADHKEALRLANIESDNDPVLKVLERLEEPDKDLHTPEVPEPPKEKFRIKLDSSSMSIDVGNSPNNIDTEETKGVLVNCARCNQILTIPIPKKKILNSELPVVAISFVHKNKEGLDQHSITIYLDHDFDIRRQRYSDVIISE